MAQIEEELDPRLETNRRQGAMPVVTLPRQGAPTWLLASLAGFAAVGLFTILEVRRQATPEVDPAVAASDNVLLQAPPPPLYVPANLTAPPPRRIRVPIARLRNPPAVAAMPAPEVQRPVIVQQAAPVPQPGVYQPQLFQTAVSTAQPREAGGAALVVDNTGLSANDQPAGAVAGAPGVGAGTATGQQEMNSLSLGARARAGMLANRATTIPQGTLIPAVIETAFNSDRPGFARAIVSRDVRGFDGSRVLIPRGSRLIGEYRSDTARGQKRALIHWVRLLRPDGVTMTISSPSTDTLGRGGVKANVNSHFFERFAGAILRTSVDVGLAVAALHSRNSPVLVGLPTAVQGSGLGASSGSNQIRTTLTVPAARSISVFVARDLDFTGVSGGA